MADSSLSDGGFCLPAEFLTDEDILMDKHNFTKKGLNSNPTLTFPTEFPYELGSVGSSTHFLNSFVESFTEFETEEDDFLAGLTRQFALSTLRETRKLPYAASRKPEETWGLSASPQSTLSPAFSNGSPNGPSQGPSSPTGPFAGNDAAWDLICAAAGQVNMLKMKSEGPIKSRVPLAPTRSITPLHPANPNTSHFQQVRAEKSQIWGQPHVHRNRGSSVYVENGGGYVGNVRVGNVRCLPDYACPTVPVQKQQFFQNQQPKGGGVGVRSVFPGGGSCGLGFAGGVKRESAGTGVFLPRRYLPPSESRNKSGGTPGGHASRVQPINGNFDNMSSQSQNQAQSHFSNAGLVSDYDLIMARRNALLAQQRRNNMMIAEGMMNCEIRLPQEWSY